MNSSEVIRIDPKRRSVFLTGNRRIGFAAARRAGIDVEALMSSSDFHAVQASHTYYVRTPKVVK